MKTRNRSNRSNRADCRDDAARERTTRTFWDNEFLRFGHKYGVEPCALAKSVAQSGYLKRGTHLLEVGGGTGRNSRYFAKNGLHVTMVDISDVAISIACHEASAMRPVGPAKTIHAIHANLFTLPDFVKEETYDAVFSNFVLHLFSEEEQRRIIDISTTLLRPGGLFISSFLSTNDADYTLAMKGEFGNPTALRTWNIRGFSQHFFEEKEVRELLSTLHLVELRSMLETELINTKTCKTSFWMVVAQKPNPGEGT
jgi:cyclopropane fatty-acyl-phospholipid synthase-like methyltransferase